MKTYGRSGGIDPCVLNRGTRWRWKFSSTPRVILLPWKQQPVCT